MASRIDASLGTHRKRGSCEGIGLVVPGMVEQETGRVLNAPQLGWRDVNIRDALQEATGHPVFIENAARATALAQLWLGGETEHQGGDFVYISIFEGVGAGVAVNGQVVRGHGHLAGELGHVVIDPAGPPCMCGSRGCLEAHTSNLATLARYLGMERVRRRLRRD